jgi:hypothetical protein
MYHFTTTVRPTVFDNRIARHRDSSFNGLPLEVTRRIMHYRPLSDRASWCGMALVNLAGYSATTAERARMEIEARRAWMSDKQEKQVIIAHFFSEIHALVDPQSMLPAEYREGLLADLGNVLFSREQSMRLRSPGELAEAWQALLDVGSHLPPKRIADAFLRLLGQLDAAGLQAPHYAQLVHAALNRAHALPEPDQELFRLACRARLVAQRDTGQARQQEFDALLSALRQLPPAQQAQVLGPLASTVTNLPKPAQAGAAREVMAAASAFALAARLKVVLAFCCSQSGKPSITLPRGSLDTSAMLQECAGLPQEEQADILLDLSCIAGHIGWSKLLAEQGLTLPGLRTCFTRIASLAADRLLAVMHTFNQRDSAAVDMRDAVDPDTLAFVAQVLCNEIGRRCSAELAASLLGMLAGLLGRRAHGDRDDRQQAIDVGMAREVLAAVEQMRRTSQLVTRIDEARLGDGDPDECVEEFHAIWDEAREFSHETELGIKLDLLRCLPFYPEIFRLIDTDRLRPDASRFPPVFLHALMVNDAPLRPLRYEGQQEKAEALGKMIQECAPLPERMRADVLLAIAGGICETLTEEAISCQLISEVVDAIGKMRPGIRAPALAELLKKGFDAIELHRSHALIRAHIEPPGMPLRDKALLDGVLSHCALLPSADQGLVLLGLAGHIPKIRDQPARDAAFTALKAHVARLPPQLHAGWELVCRGVAARSASMAQDQAAAFWQQLAADCAELPAAQQAVIRGIFRRELRIKS